MKPADAIILVIFLAVAMLTVYGAGKREGFMDGFTAAAPFVAAGLSIHEVRP